MPTRRDVLAGTSLFLAAGLAGCDAQPVDNLHLEATPAGPAARGTSTTLPFEVTVELTTVEDRAESLVEGLELVALDGCGSVLAAAALGDYAWTDAPAADRQVVEPDSWVYSEYYVATFQQRADLTFGTLPAAVGFRFGEHHVSYGGPGWAISAECQRISREEPPGATLEPDDFEPVTVGYEAYDQGSLVAPHDLEPLPRSWSPTPLDDMAAPDTVTSVDQSRCDAEPTATGTPSGNAQSPTTGGPNVTADDGEQ